MIGCLPDLIPLQVVDLRLLEDRTSRALRLSLHIVLIDR